jgi:nucleotide-binding universal stress UspA family protein
MKRFENILLVYDGTERGESTLKRTVNLATTNQASLTVIDVIDEIPRDYQMLITALLPEEILETIVKDQREHLEHYITPIREAGCKVNAKGSVGKEFLEIIREVLRNKHDLVIKTARGKGGVRDILFGSTGMHLMRKCPCPVWMMKPGQIQPYDRILAAVDVSPADTKENALNTKIMDLATSLAHLELSELHIVYVWNFPNKNLMNSELGKSPGNFQKWESETHKLHKRYLEDFLKKNTLNKVKCQVHLLKGKASDLVPQLAEKMQINLIIMGTLCRVGIPGFFIGNTAEKVLHRVNCSVLTVKPEDFISPVMIDE